MINFVTGLPRSGKTLCALSFVKREAEKDQRPVYTCNIPAVTIEGWKTIDHPDEWMDCPDGSIIIIDELQDFWGNTGTNVKPPPPILELSKHGKRGIDFWIITQEPELVHKTPRLLCQFHYYVVRVFGTQNALVHKFSRMQTHPDKVPKKASARLAAIPYKYPKEAYGRQDKKTGIWVEKPWYKSADTHNVKREIPYKVYALPIVLALAGLSLWGAVHMFKGVLTSTASGMQPVSGGAVGSDANAAVARPPGSTANARPPGPITTAEYVASYQPRIQGLPYTAPAYDELTKPSRVPMPAACISWEKRGCHCFTQDGTKLNTTDAICKEIAAHGFFEAFQRDKGSGDSQGAATRQRAGQAPPAASLPAAYTTRSLAPQDLPTGSPSYASHASLTSATPSPDLSMYAFAASTRNPAR
ncbi:zonular occludens toxin domain-containing protein [Xylophilus ampelinus]|uniref:Zonular occludens toxin Zot n=1 Tax=Xylophilus ampelinus TaxID=54067 RepID=A0A318SK98_9BURK|nr:zonular occludens toxin domain-containing protein [Xylophilus ampelinus]MCS4508776.1 zonular occludens toxin domain-containing protein [Xylophilus ampelinus]PYE79345.1 zonular occludens toxin Zot [Xylophilus ampelinus]